MQRDHRRPVRCLLELRHEAGWHVAAKSYPTIPASVPPKPKDEKRSEWSALLRVLGILCLIVGVVAGIASNSAAMFFMFVAVAIPFFFFAFLADVCTENRWLLKKLLEKKGRDDA
jgi:uncharacterized membrane protein